MSETIEHDVNGPFVRAARMSEPCRSEAVFAIEVHTQKKGVEYWGTRPEPYTDDEVGKQRQDAYRFARSMGWGRVYSVRRAARIVTITATDWEVEADHE